MEPVGSGGNDPGLLEPLHHLRCEELVAGWGEVDAVGREDPLLGVGLVVFGEVGSAGLAEIDERGLHVGSHAAGDVGVFIEHAVERIGAGLLLADHRRRAEHRLPPNAADLVDERPEPLLEFPFRRAAAVLAVPDVVDPDVNDDDIGLAGEDVAVEPGKEVGHPVAGDPGADHFRGRGGRGRGERLAGECHVAMRAGPRFGDRVAEEHDPRAVRRVGTLRNRHRGDRHRDGHRHAQADAPDTEPRKMDHRGNSSERGDTRTNSPGPAVPPAVYPTPRPA